MINEDVSLNTVDEVLEGESIFVLKASEETNKCIVHVVQLITDSYTLYMNDAYASSTFLSIAVIEEVAKIHMGIYIKEADYEVKRDKLKNHIIKEIIGASYTISMDERLKKAIGEKAFEDIYKKIYSGNLKSLREQSIYCERKNDKILTPGDFIDKELSKNLLLFAIEFFDDHLVGHSSLSHTVSQQIDRYFDEIASM